MQKLANTSSDEMSAIDNVFFQRFNGLVSWTEILQQVWIWKKTTRWFVVSHRQASSIEKSNQVKSQKCRVRRPSSVYVVVLEAILLYSNR